jgi:hypothetical protein
MKGPVIKEDQTSVTQLTDSLVEVDHVPADLVLLMLHIHGLVHGAILLLVAIQFAI